MRILHLVSSALFSGPVPPTLALALAQRELGAEVWLATDTRRGAWNPYEEAIGARLESLDLLPPMSLALSPRASPARHWQDLRHLSRWSQAGAVDVVHAHMSHDHILMALSAGSPVRVRTLHADRSLQARWGQGWLLRSCDGLIVRCAAHRALVQARFGLPQARLALLRGSVDTQALQVAAPPQRLAARAALGLPQDAVVLGQVALMHDRGHATLLQALAALPSQGRPHLLWVGRGVEEEALQAQVRELGLEPWVHFAGYAQGMPALQRAYAAMDAAFLARPGNDASARAALEAMAAGLPLLAVSQGVLAELVDDSVGFRVARCSPAAIATALRRWLSSSDLGRARGRRGRAWVVQQRSIKAEAAASLAFYRQLRAGNRRGARPLLAPGSPPG